MNELKISQNKYLDLISTFNESWNIIQNNPDEVDTQIDQINFSKTEFNIIIEGFAYGWFFEIDKFWDVLNKYKHGMLMLYYVLKTYPYGIFNLMYYHTIEEQQELVKQLEEIDSEQKIIITKYTQHMTIYTKYLNEYYVNYDSRPCTLNFNNFMNIKFNQTSVNFDEVEKHPNRLIIHAGFNNECDSYTYPRVKSIFSNFLTEREMNSFKTVRKIHIHKYPNCYELFGDGDEIIIVLCYDNNTVQNKCLYSISENTFTKKQINIITHGGIIGTIPYESVMLYMSKMKYNRLNLLSDIPDNSNEDITEKMKLLNKVNESVKKSFNQDCNKAIQNIIKCFPDDKYFGYYMHGLKKYEENGKIEFAVYLEYVKLYFIPIIN